jgi:hypothetical protein
MANQGFFGRAGKAVVGMVLVAATWSCAGQIRAAAGHAGGQPTAAVHTMTAPVANRVAKPAAEQPSTKTSAPVKTHLRRLTGREINRALVQHAHDIIMAHHEDAFGTEIPFEVDGKRYVGRIERHYHPEGGPLRPWGFHHGCSLFAVEQG